MKEKIKQNRMKKEEESKIEMIEMVNEGAFLNIEQIVISLGQIQLMENIYSVKTIKELKQILIERLKEHTGRLKAGSVTSEEKIKKTVKDVENFIKKIQ